MEERELHPTMREREREREREKEREIERERERETGGEDNKLERAQ